MSASGRCGGRRWERSTVVGDDRNGYVETDPTGRYGRLAEVLGKGAMKTVYRGFDEVRGVEVAWNQATISDVLRTPDALHRMYAEVSLLADLRHDAIISFHASWVDPSPSRRSFNFITELFSSGTLRSYRLRYPRVSRRAIAAWARHLLRGLAYLHSRGVIHRDLKCDNIFVNGHLGQVKIGDLGLAAVLRGCSSAHSVIGTPEFMAPEMYDEHYGVGVDVYSFGMCMLEMLTNEYPYSECDNPAQIYKKVTAGKLPDAFYRLTDPEARRFIGRCLVAASHRPSAEELLIDPFLSPSQHHDDHNSNVITCHSAPPPPPLPLITIANSEQEEGEEAPAAESTAVDMTITGKLNKEHDTIFLKVQIGSDESSRDGHGGNVRNIYFPFDIVNDTAMEVATEMVKELDIGEREPREIAAMIEQEIVRLVPGYKQQQQEYSYADDHDDDDDDGHPNPFYYLSSSPTSSQESLGRVGLTSSGGFPGPHGKVDCSRDYCYYRPPSSSSVSVSDDDDCTASCPTSAGSQQQHCSSSSRLGPAAAAAERGGHAGRPRQREGEEERRRRRMTRNRSMVDMRSQLLHRTLVEELNKRLFFNTVGAVHDIGFRDPTTSSSQQHRRSHKHQHYMFSKSQ
ncbi:probable serine/threonine-protein kinase WNK8 [Oryza brachyantha]|uniref:probable serine/threonine-protein kinase WNK8 n=1 Tax=Oryza brachyantha TaxID=4533 RepID=UPI001ADBBF96|nr:probable serine/threonine-protein kinase WNK8 [Oryza brachyantha]